MAAIAVLLLSVGLIVLQGGIRAALQGGSTCVEAPTGAGCLPGPGGGGGGPPSGPIPSTSSTSTSSTSSTTSTTVP
jgi:hypothetical protein